MPLWRSKCAEFFDLGRQTFRLPYRKLSALAPKLAAEGPRLFIRNAVAQLWRTHAISAFHFCTTHQKIRREEKWMRHWQEKSLSSSIFFYCKCQGNIARDMETACRVKCYSHDLYASRTSCNARQPTQHVSEWRSQTFIDMEWNEWLTTIICCRVCSLHLSAVRENFAICLIH